MRVKIMMAAAVIIISLSLFLGYSIKVETPDIKIMVMKNNVLTKLYGRPL